MGCAASREKLEKADIASAKGGMTPDQCVARAPAAAQTAFILQEKFFTLGGDFEIKDQTGATAFTVKGKVFTFRDKKVISDKEGTKLCVLQKKLLSFRPCAAMRLECATRRPAPALCRRGGAVLGQDVPNLHVLSQLQRPRVDRD